MKEQLINPAAILAAAVIDKMEKQPGQQLHEAIAEAFIQAYRGLEIASKEINRQNPPMGVLTPRHG